MKKLLFLSLLFCGLKASAQNYLITFAGTGESTTVSTVKVENLTKGTSLTLNGSYFLRLTLVTGVHPIEDNQQSELTIYPNPATDNATLGILPPVEGNAVITVFDIIGKPVVQYQTYLENSRQGFILSGLKKGFYLINVMGKEYQFSGKLLSDGKSHGTISIEKVNNVANATDEKPEKNDSKGPQTVIDMEYSTGERLMFTAISGNYSTVKTDIPTSDKIITFNFIACSDGDNNNYPVVEIGTQVWMAENLKTTKYNNGDLIGTTTPARLDIRNEITPKYQWAYGGIEANAATRGRLYTWYAVMDSRSVCPTGWHVPTDTEWKTLEMFLGMTQEQVDSTGLRGTSQGTQLKSSDIWLKMNSSCYGPGTNTFGFAAKPFGHRVDSGSFESGNGSGYWWSSTENGTSPSGAWIRYLLNEYPKVFRNTIGKVDGLSVRCLKDN